MVSDNDEGSRRYSVRISSEFEALLTRQVDTGKFQTIDEAIEYYSNLGLDLTTRKIKNLKKSIENRRLLGKKWGRPPFGLQYKDGVLIENPSEMKTIRSMYKDKVRGLSLSGLSKKYGKTRQTIRYILMNSKYEDFFSADGFEGRLKGYIESIFKSLMMENSP